MNTFLLEIVTPKGTFFEGQVQSVNLASSDGAMTIMANHIPIAAPIIPCPLKMVIDGKERICAIDGGLLYHEANKTRIIADFVIDSDKIDRAYVEKKKREAEERIKTSANEVERDLAKLALSKAINQLRVRK